VLYDIPLIALELEALKVNNLGESPLKKRFKTLKNLMNMLNILFVSVIDIYKDIIQIDYIEIV